ncbi:deoxyribodipyrimidine photo-lyase [Cryomorphaceae bacterium 1068]|nr:deoxyribodipyrimidine photo-lyase [Cryomorphaceae bacterium 1068]
MNKKEIVLFWFRRDLRLEDNAGLFHALKSHKNVLPLFIFDREILDKLEDKKDARVQFIHQEIERISKQLKGFGSGMMVRYGNPIDIWKDLLETHSIKAAYVNNDYEPYARNRDEQVANLLRENGIELIASKDHVIFEKSEVTKDDGDPYVVFTPYSKKWLAAFDLEKNQPFQNEKYFDSFLEYEVQSMPSLEEMGFESFEFEYPSREVQINIVDKYDERRDIPSIRGTSRLSLHLRFGTVSLRKLVGIAQKHNHVWLKELIWRDFYQMIIWHFPHSAKDSFRPAYDKIPWRNNEDEFETWCQGKTGYPIVDAGMRELNATGFMHNRVRMVTASFLTKHLLIDWRWGEAYFAKKLLDYELASNVGGWQWASGSGCDAAPYFRVFNPELQTKKFDPEMKYIKKWVPEFQELTYKPVVEHKMARNRAIETYKKALSE